MGIRVNTKGGTHDGPSSLVVLHRSMYGSIYGFARRAIEFFVNYECLGAVADSIYQSVLLLSPGP